MKIFIIYILFNLILITNFVYGKDEVIEDCKIINKLVNREPTYDCCSGFTDDYEVHCDEEYVYNM